MSTLRNSVCQGQRDAVSEMKPSLPQGHRSCCEMPVSKGLWPCAYSQPIPGNFSELAMMPCWDYVRLQRLDKIKRVKSGYIY